MLSADEAHRCFARDRAPGAAQPHLAQSGASAVCILVRGCLRQWHERGWGLVVFVLWVVCWTCVLFFAWALADRRFKPKVS
ncbi:hypothetical protein AK812_SmicGene18328 [Symbiodinium microadriaticum]|uniref:Uncharacterized protein n=1 Tax=Symbiodinium microadriaticum TaxID=2951 RepID=A0A1Q9DVE8_SYMMI|nr:hypothetical protein AK812_SmicGene18328 [Symbiodinium microadriaticum]CAE7293800.1 unnamed protein product [Symbiodinium sp. KB8]